MNWPFSAATAAAVPAARPVAMQVAAPRIDACERWSQDIQRPLATDMRIAFRVQRRPARHTLWMPRKREFQANAAPSEFIDMGRRYDRVALTAEAIRAQLIGQHHCHIGHLRSTTVRIKLIGLTNIKKGSPFCEANAACI